MADKESRSIEEIEKELALLEKAEKKDLERIKILQDRKKAFQDILVLLPQEIKYMEDNLSMAKALEGIETNKKKQKELHSEILRQDFELAQKKYLQEKLSENVNKEELARLEQEMLAKKKLYEQDQTRLKIQEKINETMSSGLNYVIGLARSFFAEAMQVQQDMAKYGKPDLLDVTNYNEVNTKFTEFGIGLKEMSQSMMALDKNFAAFQNLNKETQLELAGTAAKMQNLGVSAEEWGKNLNEFSRGIGMNSKQASAELNKIVVEATRAGITPQKAMADLSSAFGQLSASGAKAGKIFIELQKQSKELGIEVNSMLNIVGKSFDTFEGAADKAGKLNSILGGDYLNSVEMLNATEEERVKLMRDAFQQSGKNWDELDRFTKKSIAATLGFKDEAEARKMLGHISVEERLRLKSEEEAQKQLEKAQKGSVEVTRMFQMALYDLMPVMAILADAFRSVAKFAAEHKHIVGGLTVTIIGLWAAYKAGTAIAAMMKVLGAIGGIFKSMGKGAKESGEAVKEGMEKSGEGAEKGSRGMANAITRIGRAAMRSATGLAMLALIVVAIGVSIAAAALGIAEMAKSFAGLGEAAWPAAVAIIALVAGMTLMVVVLIAVGTSATAVAPGLGVFAGVILAIGVSVAIAAAGIGFMVGQLAGLLNALTEEKVSLFGKLAIGLLAVGTALATLSLNPFFVFGLAAIAATMIAIKKAIDAIPTDEVFKGKVEIVKTIGDTLTVATQIKSENIKPAKEFVDSAKNYYDSQKTAKAADQDALAQTLKQIFSTEKKGGGETDKGIPVVIKINDFDMHGKMFGVNLIKATNKAT